MAAFHDVSKLEKKSFSIVAPVRRHNHLRLVANAFRVLEVCLAIALLFWISAQLPVAVRTFSEYWRHILSFITRPLVVFVFFNAIVAAVASKAGRLACQTPIDGDYYYTDDFYEEMVKLNESRSKSSSTSSSLDHYNNNHEEDKEIIFQDKQIIISSTTPATTQAESGIGSEYSESEKAVVKCPNKVYRRTKSEKMSKRNQSQGRQLRRSETTKLRKVGLCGGDHESSASDDELSSDELQRAIEEFIAKQLRFRREESMAIVLK